MTKIIIETDDEHLKNNANLLRLTLLDAFYEFVSHRGPTAEAYVNKRYPEDEGYDWLNREEKVREVRWRIWIANELHQATLELNGREI